MKSIVDFNQNYKKLNIDIKNSKMGKYIHNNKTNMSNYCHSIG